jgi:hypothetical protein
MEQLSNVIRRTNLKLRIGEQGSAVTGIGMQVAGLLLPEAFILFSRSWRGTAKSPALHLVKMAVSAAFLGIPLSMSENNLPLGECNQSAS